jgi:3-dehydro-4-phosphotetronate decarboxylase
LALAVTKLASDHHAVLLANHGPVVSGTSLSTALFATEELEETAKLFCFYAGLKKDRFCRINWTNSPKNF